MKVKKLRILFVLLVALLTATAAFAQDYRGKVQGTVSDDSGAIVPGAKVVLHNDKTGVDVSTIANDEGRYIFNFVEPGSYSVIVEKTGFKKTDQKNLVVRIQGDLTVDVKMAVGDVSAVVTIEDSPVAVQFNSSSTGITIENTTIDQLPVRGRNPYNIATLDPSVNGGEAAENRPYHHAFANEIDAGGGTTRANEVQLNGVALTSSYKVSYTPSVDAVSEVTFQRSAVDSEQGFSSGGTISLNMKSGTDKYHGAGFYYKRDPRFNAFGDPTLVRIDGADEKIFRGTDLSMFGGNVGGPIIKKKLFFFTSYEKWKDARPITVKITLPTALERGGDFSLSGRNIYDPLTSTGTSGVRTQFAGNIIPINRFDPVAVRLLQELPLPNLPGTQLNWQGSKTENVDYWNFSTRVDLNFSERLKTFVSYGHFKANLLESNPTAKKLFPITGSNRYGLSIAADTVYTINARTVLNVRANYHQLTDEAAVKTVLLGQSGLSTLFGGNTFYSSLYTNDQVYYPALDVGAGNRLGRTGREFWQHPQGYGGSARINTYIGNHSIKFGAEYRVDKGKGARFEPLNFWFRQNLTQNQNSGANTATGNEWASFLLGVLEPNGTSTATNNFARRVPVQEVVSKGYAAYVMDDWKFNNRLSLNLGLRWEFEPGPVDRYNRLTQRLDLTNPIPEFQTNPVVIPASVTTLLASKNYSHKFNGAWVFTDAKNRHAWDRYPFELMPRLGFAFKIDDNSALRFGYARFIQPSSRIRDPLGDFVEQYTGYSTTTFVAATINGVPQATLSNPYPTSGTTINPVQLPTEQTLGRYTNLGNAVTLDQYDQRPPLNERFNLSYQRGIWQKMILSLEAFYNYGHRLPYTVDINAIDPAYLYENPRTVTNATVTNPFRNYLTPNIFPGALRNPATVTVASLLRPFPQYGAINQVNTAGRKSTTQSYKIQVQKPFTKGLTFLASYAYNIEQTTEFFDDIATYKRDFQWRDTNAPRHRFTNTVTWDIPLGKGRAFLSDAPRVLDAIVGGWKLTNTSRYYSGRLLQFTQSLVVVGNPKLEKPSVTGLWFNKAAFQALPTTGVGTDRSIVRTSAYTYNGVVGPSTFQTDATMSKAFKLTEKFKLEARVEVYNLLNNINWENPVVDFTNSNFGKVTAKRAQYVGREVQYGLRLTF
jgi:Carboxypeptidase regulatory-like domain/TonB dependent receptor